MMVHPSLTEIGVRAACEGDDEDYVHITGTNMGTIEPATWNDLEDDPQYFPFTE